MTPKRIALAGCHLILRMAIKHPPKVIAAVAGVFVFHFLMARLRHERWLGAIFYAILMTAVFIFVAACIYAMINTVL
jgi:hypothetical protein